MVSSPKATVTRRVSTPTEGNLAVEPEWRREVTSRLHSYRKRRHGVEAADEQSSFLFEPPEIRNHQIQDIEEGIEDTPAAMASLEPQAVPNKERTERYEISIPMQDFLAPSTLADRPANQDPRDACGKNAFYPVAKLSLRRKAAVLDGVLLLFSYGGMLALFSVLGGHIGFNKIDLIVTGATLVLFYAQYFALFTVFGGPTPGMMIRKLRVVSFDGNMPTSRQLAWRSFGYLVSAGTCFLGFLWALWDEDQLCWQDRISQTYITPLEQFTAGELQTRPASHN